jgi:hypothetical protein
MGQRDCASTTRATDLGTAAGNDIGRTDPQLLHFEAVTTAGVLQ